MKWSNNMRKWVANRLVRLARRIHPENEEVMQFMADRMMDLMITGQSTVKIERVPPDAYRIGWDDPRKPGPERDRIQKAAAEVLKRRPGI